MTNVPKYYWDACIWIELINQASQARVERCKYVIELAQVGKAQIWTSAFTLAEVWKRKCEGNNVGIQESKDKDFEDFIEQPFVKKVAVDFNIGHVARRLLRRYPTLGKPQDAIHVASCMLYNIDVLHTFDERDLTKLDGMIPRIDKKMLAVGPPPEIPPGVSVRLFDDE